MPAARYWRVVGMETYSGGDLELSELHLYGAAGRLDPAATLSSTVAPVAGTLAALQDNNLTTTCRFAASAVRSGGFAVIWDFGPAGGADAFGVRLGAAGSADTFLAVCTLEYSVDGASWVFLGNFNRYEFPGESQYTKPPVEGDGYFSQVSALLHCDGANGSAVFTDSSPSPKTFTRSGSAQISTAQAKFGGASAYFSGGGGSYVYAPASADFGFGTGDFTIEGWMRSTVRDEVFLDLRDRAIEAGVFIANHPDKGGGIAYYETATGVIGGNTPTDDGNWHHYAWTRVSGVFRMFSDGVKVYEGLLTSDFGSIRPCWLGVQFGGTAAFFNGYQDDIRITKGVGRYNANFTPPVRAYPDGTVDPNSTVFVAPMVHTTPLGGEKAAASAPVPAATTTFEQPLSLACDIEFGGNYRIYGTVSRKAQLANIPLRRRVRLHRSKDGYLVRETWSHTDGSYAFNGISGRYEYDVIAWDHELQDFSTVANNQLAEVVE